MRELVLTALFALAVSLSVACSSPPSAPVSTTVPVSVPDTEPTPVSGPVSMPAPTRAACDSRMQTRTAQREYLTFLRSLRDTVQGDMGSWSFGWPGMGVPTETTYHSSGVRDLPPYHLRASVGRPTRYASVVCVPPNERDGDQILELIVYDVPYSGPSFSPVHYFIHDSYGEQIREGGGSWREYESGDNNPGYHPSSHVSAYRAVGWLSEGLIEGLLLEDAAEIVFLFPDSYKAENRRGDKYTFGIDGFRAAYEVLIEHCVQESLPPGINVPPYTYPHYPAADCNTDSCPWHQLDNLGGDRGTQPRPVRRQSGNSPERTQARRPRTK